MKTKNAILDDNTELCLLGEGECNDCMGSCSPSPKILFWPAGEHPVLPTLPWRYHLLLILGSLLALTGILTLIWKPVGILMHERLRMVKGLPPYEWWKTPPDEVLLKAYVFNVTNSEEFMSGEADKLNVQEVGPYIFKEKLYHTNVKFNDNGTMTYTATRIPEFIPEMNTLSLDDKIIVANLATLGIPSFMWDASVFTRMGVSVLVSRISPEPFREISVNDYFWNFTDPLLKFTSKVAPHLVPIDNMGILHEIYRDFVDDVTVYIGVKNGPFKFFKIDKWRGGSGMGKWDNETCDSVQGSSEGVHYHQGITREDHIKYLRKTICRAVPLYYSKDVKINGISAFRFDLPNSTWTKDNIEDDCYIKDKYPHYPSGVTDISPCYYNLPIVSSFPHFMSASDEVTEKLTGLTPDWEKHGSAAIVEPITGIPLTAWARSQCSIFIQDMKGFPRFKKFSRMPIPMFWLEYRQVGLPGYISNLVYFVAMVLPSIQVYISLGLLLIAFVIFSTISSKIFNKFMFSKKISYSSVKIISTKEIPETDKL